MGCGGRMDHEALRISDICEMREDLQGFNEASSRFETSLNPECKHSSCALRQVAPRERVIPARRQPGVVHPRHSRVPLQKLRNRQRILRMTLHAQLQGLQSLKKQERVERTERRTEIPETFHPRLHDVREIAEGFVEADPVV